MVVRGVYAIVWWEQQQSGFETIVVRKAFLGGAKKITIEKT